jgi:hypothetical protein
LKCSKVFENPLPSEIHTDAPSDDGHHDAHEEAHGGAHIPADIRTYEGCEPRYDLHTNKTALDAGGKTRVESRIVKRSAVQRSVFVATTGLAITTTTTTSATSTATATTTTAATTVAAATAAAAAVATTATLTAAAAAAATAAAARTTVERRHVLSLWTLLTLSDLELDLLAFLELPEAPALDRGEVHEAIFSAVVRRDETIPLLSIEPLDYPCRAHRALSPGGVLEVA